MKAIFKSQSNIVPPDSETFTMTKEYYNIYKHIKVYTHEPQHEISNNMSYLTIFPGIREQIKMFFLCVLL